MKLYLTINIYSMYMCKSLSFIILRIVCVSVTIERLSYYKNVKNPDSESYDLII
jgi:uncharacterized membrane protein